MTTTTTAALSGVGAVGASAAVLPDRPTLAVVCGAIAVVVAVVAGEVPAMVRLGALPGRAPARAGTARAPVLDPPGLIESRRRLGRGGPADANTSGVALTAEAWQTLTEAAALTFDRIGLDLAEPANHPAARARVGEDIWRVIESPPMRTATDPAAVAATTIRVLDALDAIGNQP